MSCFSTSSSVMPLGLGCRRPYRILQRPDFLDESRLTPRYQGRWEAADLGCSSLFSDIVVREPRQLEGAGT